jgi:hypothetical protein
MAVVRGREIVLLNVRQDRIGGFLSDLDRLFDFPRLDARTGRQFSGRWWRRSFPSLG